MKCVVLTTGGTGGHIFPALAVGDMIMEKFPDCKIFFIGTNNGLEKKMVKGHKFAFIGLPVEGFLGRGPKMIKASFNLVRGLIKAYFTLRKIKPEIVVGFGGYASFAAVYCACRMGIPTVLHEQNSVLGAANKTLAKKANCVLCSFENTKGLPENIKTIITGNPVRNNIMNIGAKKQISECRNLLILGGSQGAHVINVAIAKIAEQLTRSGIKIWHQTGKYDFAEIKQIYADKCSEVCVDSFIEDMEKAYTFADLVIARAGATTISELLVAAKPSILIPFPYAANNHQEQNAKILENAGASLVINQAYLAEIDLLNAILNLFDASGKLQIMAENAQKLGNPNATKAVCDIIFSLVNGENK